MPCYTEGETSLRWTIDSLAQLKYDDKWKLIPVICGDNIVGSGNDRPTPRIVFEILGADPNREPEAISFVSLSSATRSTSRPSVRGLEITLRCVFMEKRRMA
ncbi:hypothetical protein AZE42_01578 [Rhizopogon vesiculosus]|uniref:Uncharacterized protein n=1 Tax=Rhizopogon vesiculosus TaxID=180088 RepID=A0A1J8PYE9_9AGAM|nr:hypothetical protein AZE42_01578 [Rhizopogon vesiculosus]